VESVDDSALRIDAGVHLHITTRSAAWTASGSRLDIGDVDGPYPSQAEAR
jgi:hypothetical protein